MRKLLVEAALQGFKKLCARPEFVCVVQWHIAMPSDGASTPSTKPGASGSDGKARHIASSGPFCVGIKITKRH